jgi:hypothetical protein
MEYTDKINLDSHSAKDSEHPANVEEVQQVFNIHVRVSEKLVGPIRDTSLDQRVYT